MQVSYLKKAAFIRAGKSLCDAKSLKPIFDALVKGRYKPKLIEIKPYDPTAAPI